MMWQSIITDWLSLGFRWLHIVSAVAWIGSSFYFIHLDLSLKPAADLPDGVQGNAWQVHGGGFYRIVKYLVAPKAMPDELTWFKWEAYTTWLSGIALMVVVYYLDADLFLIDKAHFDLTPLQAAAFSAGSLALAWILYDVACKTGLARNEGLLAFGGYLFLVGLTYAFTHVLSGRGALNQIGAIVGTIMVANVFLVIIPNQKKIVAALLAGQPPDPALGKSSKLRSVHNNYLTLARDRADDEQSLSADLRHPLQLADCRDPAAARPGDPAFLQFAARRQEIAMVGMDRGGGGHGRDRLAVGGRAGDGHDQARCRRPRPSLRSRKSCRPAAACATPASRSGKRLSPRRKRSCSIVPSIFIATRN